MHSELHGPGGMHSGYGPPLVDGGYGEDPSGWGTPWGGVREAALSARRQHAGGVGHYGGGFRASRSAQNRQQSRWHDVGEQGGPYSQNMYRQGDYGQMGGYGGYNSGLPRAYGQPGNYGGPNSVKEGGRVPFGYRARNNAENRRQQRYGDY